MPIVEAPGFPAARMGSCPDARSPRRVDDRAMKYAVRWRQDDGPDRVGGLAIDRRSIVLADARESLDTPALQLGIDELADIFLERQSGGATGGRPTLVILTHGGTRVQITSLEGLGALHELAEQLALVRR